MSLGTEVGLGPYDIVLDGRPVPPSPQKRGRGPNFRPMSIVAKGSPISAAAELLLRCGTKTVGMKTVTNAWTNHGK